MLTLWLTKWYFDLPNWNFDSIPIYEHVISWKYHIPTLNIESPKMPKHTDAHVPVSFSHRYYKNFRNNSIISQ